MTSTPAPERIAKFLSAAGVASRRVAERMIEEGRVSINNEVVETPATLVTKSDIVTVDGAVVDKPKRTRLFVYHKPVDVIVSTKDDQGRKTLEKALPSSLPRVVPVGRLDINSEGLLLLTTNGDLAQWLMRPTGAGFKRHYKVRVYGELESWQLNKIQHGMTIEGVQYAGAQVRRSAGKGRNVWYDVVLGEGKNREIRKLFGAFNIMVSRLMRLQYGPFVLGALPKGAVAEIPYHEVQKLIRMMEDGDAEPREATRARRDGPSPKTSRKAARYS